MTPRSESEHPCWRIIEGDCIDAMADMEPASVDAIVTDPPYGLGFMGRAWDALPPGVPWAQACLRVLKPGGHMLAFGGTRTAHRLVCAIEDAGFEIRDTIAWMYGSGFPKSLDVSKAIDKAAGVEREVVSHERRVSGSSTYDTRPSRPDGLYASDEFTRTAAATPEAQTWEGWGTALKPAFEPIVVARKPLVGTVASNVLAHGTGALNVNGCRIPSGDDHREKCESVVGLDSNRNGTAYGEWKGERESSWSPDGRWPANVVLSHASSCVPVGTRRVKTGTHVGRNRDPGAESGTYGGGYRKDIRDTTYASLDGTEAVEVWECVADCPVRMLDEQSGNVRSAGEYVKGNGAQGDKAGAASIPIDGLTSATYADSGGASRFFKIAHWTPEDGCPAPSPSPDRASSAASCSCPPGTLGDSAQDDAAISASPEDQPPARAQVGAPSTFERRKPTPTPNPAPTAAPPDDTAITSNTTTPPSSCGSAPDATPPAIPLDDAATGFGPTRFRYEPKTSSSERGADNTHPTVKPRELMRWLVRLVTPPGGTVLDPFTGSGTTGIAALREGFSFIGIEREAEYVAIARARIIGDAPLFNAGMEAA